MAHDEAYKVFALDDDPVFLEALRERISTLRLPGVSFVLETFSSREALYSNLNSSPQIVLLDYFLDEEQGTVSGQQVLFELRSHAVDVPVIILTSLKDVRKAVMLLKAGATDFVVKNSYWWDNLEKALFNVVGDLKAKRKGGEVSVLMQRYQTAVVVLAIIMVLVVLSIIIF